MLRKAVISDAGKIHELIHYWAEKGKVLERPLNYVYENIRDFWIYGRKEQVKGVAALHIVGWQGLAEVKSLAVNREFQGQGIGKSLVAACVEEAGTLEVKSLFALTFEGGFFKSLGFKKINKEKLPHKIWSDCVNCPYFPDCKEEAFCLAL